MDLGLKLMSDLEKQANIKGFASIKIRDHYLEVTPNVDSGCIFQFQYKWGVNFVHRQDAITILGTVEIPPLPKPKNKSKERYQSGTSLARTNKEERIDSFERMVGQGEEFPDTLYIALKKLTIAEIKELHKQVAERIANASR